MRKFRAGLIVTAALFLVHGREAAAHSSPVPDPQASARVFRNNGGAQQSLWQYSVGYPGFYGGLPASRALGHQRSVRFHSGRVHPFHAGHGPGAAGFGFAPRHQGQLRIGNGHVLFGH